MTATPSSAASTDDGIVSSTSEPRTDVLGEPWTARTLELGEADDGPLVATLVTRRAERPTGRAVLYVHGFCDYFFQVDLAQWWLERGYDFHALDLRRYGRSLRPGQRPNYVTDLADYDQELGLALDLLRADGLERLVVVAHSTGGLVTSLWADRVAPPELAGLVLNSPWLDMQGSALMRTVGTVVVDQVGRLQPTRQIPREVSGVYGETLHRETGGEWDFDRAWKPTASFPVYTGWLRAVRRGHARLHRGLAVDAPVLVLASSRSSLPTEVGEDSRSTDVVLDVGQIRRWSTAIGPHVTFAAVPDGVHDLALSAPTARRRFYDELERWHAAYVAPTSG